MFSIVFCCLIGIEFRKFHFFIYSTVAVVGTWWCHWEVLSFTDNKAQSHAVNANDFLKVSLMAKKKKREAICLRCGVGGVEGGCRFRLSIVSFRTTKSEINLCILCIYPFICPLWSTCFLEVCPVTRPQHLMLFPWQNCSFFTLKRPVSKMAGLLWAGDDIVSRIVPLQHTTLLLGFHGQGSFAWPQQHRGGRSLMNMCFILPSFIAERAALQLQNPASLP